MRITWRPGLATAVGIALLTVVAISMQWIAASPTVTGWDESEVLALLNRTYEGPLPNPVPVTIQPRRLAAFGALLFAGLLLLLYAYRRRTYILDWVAAWICLGLGMYVISRGYPTIGAARFAVLILQFSNIGAAIFFYLSGHSFRQTHPYSQRYWKQWMVIPALFVWLIFGHDRFDTGVVLGPAYVLSGLFLGRAAMIYISLYRERRLRGALLVAAKFTLLAGTNIAVGSFYTSVVVSTPLVMLILFINGMASFVAALGMHLLVFEDMTYELRIANRDLEAAQEELRRLATVDLLTGCYNRRFLEESIGHELTRHRRYRTPLCLVFADIDRFKAINDSHGHDMGDRVLKFVAEFLTRNVREADYVVRWGGDEFLLVMTCSGKEAASKLAVLKASFSEAVKQAALPANVRLSLGFAEIPPDATDILPLIREADQSMYADKFGSA